MWDLSPLTLGIDRPWSFCPTLMDNHRFVASFKWTLAFGLKVLRPLLLNLWHWPPFDSFEREIGEKVGGSAHRLVGRYSILDFLFSSLKSWRECTMHNAHGAVERYSISISYYVQPIQGELPPMSIKMHHLLWKPIYLIHSKKK